MANEAYMTDTFEDRMGRESNMWYQILLVNWRILPCFIWLDGDATELPVYLNVGLYIRADFLDPISFFYVW